MIAQSLSPLRMFYLDDSGTVDTGYIVYSWIETTHDAWRDGLRAWLDLRKHLYVKYKIPPAFELHATKFAAGRGNPSTDPGINMSKRVRREVMEVALEAIGSTEALRVGTVFRWTPETGSRYHQQKEAVYANLVNMLDRRLAAANEFGIILMDGDGTDPGYYRAHRRLHLTHRRVIEDPLFQAAHLSQWVQMADLTAWSAYQSLLRHEAKRFAWGWYDDYLGGVDINGGPLAV